MAEFEIAPREHKCKDGRVLNVNTYVNGKKVAHSDLKNYVIENDTVDIILANVNARYQKSFAERKE